MNKTNKGPRSATILAINNSRYIEEKLLENIKPAFDPEEHLPTSETAFKVLQIVARNHTRGQKWYSAEELYTLLYNQPMPFITKSLEAISRMISLTNQTDKGESQASSLLTVIASLIKDGILTVHRYGEASDIIKFRLNKKTRHFSAIVALQLVEYADIKTKVSYLRKVIECNFVCPVCGSQTYSDNYENDGRFGGHSWRVSSTCDGCGFTMTDTDKATSIGRENARFLTLLARGFNQVDMAILPPRILKLIQIGQVELDRVIKDLED